MQEHENKRADTHVTAEDTVFFPAIESTSEEENALIDALVHKADEFGQADANEETVFFEEGVEDATKKIELEVSSAPSTQPEKKRIQFKKIPDFVGVIPAIRARFANSKGAQVITLAFVGILLAAVLLLTLCTMVASYAISAAAILCLSLILLLFCIGLIAVGIAGLCYGIILLFTHGVLIGLIEIGLAMVLFGIILALSALSGELATGQLPKLLKFLTRLFVYLIVYVLSFVFGSARFTPDTKKEAKQ